MNLKEKRAAALKAAQDIVAKAKAESRDLTAEETTEIETKTAEVKDFDKQLDAAAKAAAAVAAVGAIAPGEVEKPKDADPSAAKSLGEHFMKHAHSKILQAKGGTFTIAAPEFKAATDTHVTTGSVWAPYLTEFDRTIVQAPRRKLTVADLISWGSISGNSIQYLIEAAVDGGFANVAESGAKPQIHVNDPTFATDSLRKIAGFAKYSDEMLEDLDFMVSEINARLTYLLGVYEEDQLLNGSGSGQNLKGILGRTGVQTETAATDVSGADNADAIFRAIGKVATASGLAADALVIHPADYQSLRLRRDANEQYYGGGFFAGQYGNGGIQEDPPVWGLRTVVTPAVASGTPVVGAWRQGATGYRKGGVRVESTNSHGDDFTNNLVTVRVEERVALAVRYPTAFCKVALDYAAPDAD